MTTATALTATQIDPRYNAVPACNVPWETGTPWGLRCPAVPREGWRETARVEALAAAQAGQSVIVRCSIPWSTPNGASGYSDAFCTYVAGQVSLANATWRKYVGRDPRGVAAFGSGGELRHALWTYYVHR